MSINHVKELKRAKQRIINNECYYICDALRREDSISIGIPWNKYGVEIQKQIMADLDNMEYCDWLFTFHKIKVPEWNDEIFPNPRYEFLKPFRLAWIDALIKYWMSKK